MSDTVADLGQLAAQLSRLKRDEYRRSCRLCNGTGVTPDGKRTCYCQDAANWECEKIIRDALATKL